MLSDAVHLLLHFALIVYYFFYFLVKGKPEWSDDYGSTTTPCITYRTTKCCLHGSSTNISSPPPPPPLAPTRFAPSKKLWAIINKCGAYLRSAWKKIKSIVCRSYNYCKQLAVRLYNWWYRRKTTTTTPVSIADVIRSAASNHTPVPWRRPSIASSTSSAAAAVTSPTLFAPPPPPPPPIQIATIYSPIDAQQQPTSSWSTTTTTRQQHQDPTPAIIDDPIQQQTEWGDAYNRSNGWKSSTIGQQQYSSTDGAAVPSSPPTSWHNNYNTWSSEQNTITDQHPLSSDTFVMGNSVYRPMPEIESMREAINHRRVSATPTPSETQSTTNNSRMATPIRTSRSRTVEPTAPRSLSSVINEHHHRQQQQFQPTTTYKYRSSVLPFDAQPLDYDREEDTMRRHVRATTHHWPPPSNATGPDVIKDLWLPPDRMLMTQSWHPEPQQHKQFVTTNKRIYQKSVFDKVTTMDEHGRMVGMPKEIHQLNREYDEVIHEPEKTYHTQSTLDAQTGKGIQLIAKRREFCDKYALETTARSSGGPFEADRLLADSRRSTHAMTNNDIDDGLRRRRDWSVDATTPVSSWHNSTGRNTVLSPTFERLLEQSRQFSPNFNSPAREWRSTYGHH